MINPNKIRSVNYELIAAIVLGVIAVGSFALQAFTLSDRTTKLETVLFNTLQFLLTIGFAWFSTRAISRNEFEANLKRFAVSAYRRISDIEDIVQRLQARISSMRVERSEQDSYDLDVIGAIVDDTAQVINSSIADWADVIGEELIAIETIKRLETEKAEIKAEPITSGNTTELDARVKKIDDKIDGLLSALPARLQFDTKREENNERHQKHAAAWMSNKHKEDNGLKLKVVAGGGYICERDPFGLAPNEPLWATIGGDGRVNVEDEAGVPLGRALNNSPLIYDSFSNALATCYGANRIPLKFEGVISTRTEMGVKYTWYSVRVNKAPTFKRSIRNKSLKEDSPQNQSST